MPKQSVSSDSHNLIDIPHIGIIAVPKELPEVIQNSIARHAHGLTHEKSGTPVNFAPKMVPNPKGITPQLDTDKPQQTITGQPIPEPNMQNAPITSLRPPVTKEPNPNAPQMRIDNAPLSGIEGAEFDVEPRLQ